MGNNTSRTLINDFYNSLFESTVTILTTMVNQTTVDNNILQNITIEIEPGATLKCGGGLVISNEANLKAAAIASLTDDQKDVITNSVTDTLRREIIKTLTQANEDLNLGQSNIVDDENNIYTSIETKIKNSIQTTIENKIAIEGTIEQTIYFKIDSNSLTDIQGDCTISNSAILESTANSITKNIMDILAEDTVTRDIADKYDIEIEQKNVGINLNMAIIAGIAIVALFYFGGLKMLLNPWFILIVIFLAAGIYVYIKYKGILF